MNVIKTKNKQYQSSNQISEFNIMKKCYDEGVLFGSECELMKDVYRYVQLCLHKSEVDTHYMYIAILILFYSQRNITHHACSFGCCTLSGSVTSQQWTRIIDEYLPQNILIQNLIISTELIQCFEIFETHFEELLLNMCKATNKLVISQPNEFLDAFVHAPIKTMIPILTQNDIDNLQQLLFHDGKKVIVECEMNMDEMINLDAMDEMINLDAMDSDQFICYVNDALLSEKSIKPKQKNHVLCYLQYIKMTGEKFKSIRKQEFDRMMVQQCNIRDLYATINNYNDSALPNSKRVEINDIYSFRWGSIVDNIKKCNKKQFIYVISLLLDDFIENNIITDRSVKYTILVYLQHQRINGALFMKMDNNSFIENIMKSGINMRYSRIFKGINESEIFKKDLHTIISTVNVGEISAETICFLPNVSTVPQLDDQSIAKLDTMVYALKMSIKYQTYLQKTIQYRASAKNEKISQLIHLSENMKIPIVDMLYKELFKEIKSNKFWLNKTRKTRKTVRINRYLQIFGLKFDFQKSEKTGAARQDDEYKDCGNIKIYYKYSNHHEIQWNTAVLYKGTFDYSEQGFVIELKDNEALGLYNKYLFDVETEDDIHPIYIEITGDKNISLSYKLTVIYANLQINNTMKQSMHTDVVLFTSDVLEYENNVAISLHDII
eukprot:532185_1